MKERDKSRMSPDFIKYLGCDIRDFAWVKVGSNVVVWKKVTTTTKRYLNKRCGTKL